MITLGIINHSEIRRLYRRAVLERLADRIALGEGVPEDLEISLLFCSDAFMKNLNGEYRNVHKTTDVLSFEQNIIDPESGRRILGDIVISMDTVQARCEGDRDAMRREISLLFCHGMLHLLGHDHDTETKRRAMQQRQALYLDAPLENVWHS